MHKYSKELTQVIKLLIDSTNILLQDILGRVKIDLLTLFLSNPQN